MALELNLQFPDPDHVVVSLKGEDDETGEPQSFVRPIGEDAQQELQWYFETYPVRYTTEIDDARAASIADRLPEWGVALFEAVFASPEARRLFTRFQDHEETGRLITISSSHPAVLAQPWELLRDPTGTHLFLEQPRVSIRRRLVGAAGGRLAFRPEAKDTLHLLFVVSRPADSGFIDPRSDPTAVLDAVESRAPGRVTVEFLRPATLSGLIRRLEDEDLPPVDILHFDGHGAYDPDGRMADAGRRSLMTAGVGAQLRSEAEAAIGPQQGYLVFEDDDGGSSLVSAEMLGSLLHRKRVGLVVLSACQSATVGGEDPMGSVAARLTRAGLPSILAMTHSVLVDTTRELFGAFYENLSRGRAIGTALDNARQHLFSNPERGERQRVEGRTTLRLQDWFLPALYQTGSDAPLLHRRDVIAPMVAPWGNIRDLQESGFHGRRLELWQIERWFVGGTRRLVIHGFGGQGKTMLAEEAGRWLHRTGMFDRVCFVGFAEFQGVDPVGFAISTLATVLDEDLIDPDAATAALCACPTLVVLDNVERLDSSALGALLAVANEWSESGISRILITTRQPDLEHPAYPTGGSLRCRYLALDGLRDEDALDWFQELVRMPPEPAVPLPEREPLLELFAMVRFHPLSIGVLARELKTRRIAEVGQRLEALMEVDDDPLMASLNLSIERLDPELRRILPRLGVLQGGAFDPVVPSATGTTKEEWQSLRGGLAEAGLLQVERIQGINLRFLRFHPTLTPALWARLSAGEREHLRVKHRVAYYQLSEELYVGDSRIIDVVRAIARRELPNLLYALNGALDDGDAMAVELVDNVNRFLGAFGLTRDREMLAKKVQAIIGEVGSGDWFRARSTLGEQLLDAGRTAEAEVIFSEILKNIDDNLVYERAVTMGRLAQCLTGGGYAESAETVLRQALSEVEKFEKNESNGRLEAYLNADLGNALLSRGDYKGARSAFETSMEIAAKHSDDRAVAIAHARLGTIAFSERRLEEAERRYRSALERVRSLDESGIEAGVWHELGIVLGSQRRWSEAEAAFRESARIMDATGHPVAAASSWSELAKIKESQKKYDEAEAWYRKALSAFTKNGNKLEMSVVFHNLAVMIGREPGRASEARELAERALAIDSTLDPAAVEIWKTYNTLGKIAGLQNDVIGAASYQRLGREAFAAVPRGVTVLRRAAPFVRAVVVAATDPAARMGVEPIFKARVEAGWTNLVEAARRILDRNERSIDILADGLDIEDAIIVQAILQGIQDPASVEAILPDETEEEAVHRLLEDTMPLIAGVVGVVLGVLPSVEIEHLFDTLGEDFARAIRRIVDSGERDPEVLCNRLDPAETLVVRTILAAIEHPDVANRLGLTTSSSSAPVVGDRPVLRMAAAMITGVVGVVHGAIQRRTVDEVFTAMADHGWTEVVAAAQKILDGERSRDVLCTDLDEEDTLIVTTILRGIQDPEALKLLLSEGISEGDSTG